MKQKKVHKPTKFTISKSFIRRLGSLLTVIMKDANPEGFTNGQTIIEGFCNGLTKRCQSRGKSEAANFYKAVHLIATKVAMGRPFTPLRFTKSDKQGIPVVIKPLIPMLKGPNVLKRLALSVTKCYSAVVIDPEVNLDLIRERPKDFTLQTSWKDFLTFWVKKFPKPRLSGDGVGHGSTKRGPNGPSLLTCHLDLASFSSDTQVLSNLFRGLDLTDPSLRGVVQSLYIKYQELGKPGLHHSRLALLPEGGGKTRVIAIPDYFTQESLKSLFRETMRALKQLETDGTYDQGRLVEKTLQAIHENKPIYCYDLSSATDRFPASLQRDLLEAWIGSDRADAGLALLTRRSFKCGEEYVEYGAGQPMGVLTSGSVFALTHHAVIEYIASLKGNKSFRDYVVLGDDVAIFNKEVAEGYHQFMEDVGVTISPTKSFIGDTTSKFPPSGEVAKRLLNREGEFTPIPYDLVNTWCKAPEREALTLRVGLESIGLRLSFAAGETLASELPKRKRKKHLLLTTCPFGLINPKGNLLAPKNLEVSEGPGTNLDYSLLEPIMCGILIRDLSRKKETIMDLHSKLFEETYWNRFTDRQGTPISRSVLGLGVLDINELHPLVVVINNQLEKLGGADEMISQLKSNPESAYIMGSDVFQYDFRITETYVDRKRQKCWKQSSLLLKLHKYLLMATSPQLINCGR